MPYQPCYTEPIMFKSSKKDLTQPLTLGDFQEFTDFFVEKVAMREDVERLVKESTNTVLTKMDAVMGELKATREEQTAKVGRDDQQDEDIVELKTRVTAVEQQAGIAPSASS